MHRAVWNEAESRVEIYLVSTQAQHVAIGAAKVELMLEKGETIWTESSYKYEPATLIRQLEGTGFRLQKQWVDAVARFAALTLLVA